MAKATIYLSPSSHGVGANKGIDKGCYEDGHTRPIAEVTAKHLEYNGFEAVIAKKGTSMQERCAESDRVGADLHIPIHTNASADEDVRYLMLMFFADTPEYRKLFDAMDDFIEAVYPGHKDAVFAVRDDLYEINTPNAKTIYLELGFHTNKTDSKFMHDEETVGKALAKGICKIYGVKFKDYTAEKKEEKPAKKPATKKPVKHETKPSAKVTFIKEVQEAIGAEVDGIAGPETVGKTVTLSAVKNRNHKAVKAVQKYLNHLGYDCGEEDGIAGPKFTVAVRRYQYARSCVVDGEITAKEKTWQKLLGLA